MVSYSCTGQDQARNDASMVASHDVGSVEPGTDAADVSDSGDDEGCSLISLAFGAVGLGEMDQFKSDQTAANAVLGARGFEPDEVLIDSLRNEVALARGHLSSMVGSTRPASPGTPPYATPRADETFTLAANPIDAEFPAALPTDKLLVALQPSTLITSSNERRDLWTAIAVAVEDKSGAVTFLGACANHQQEDFDNLASTIGRKPDAMLLSEVISTAESTDPVIAPLLFPPVAGVPEVSIDDWLAQPDGQRDLLDRPLPPVLRGYTRVAALFPPAVGTAITADSLVIVRSELGVSYRASSSVVGPVAILLPLSGSLTIETATEAGDGSLAELKALGVFQLSDLRLSRGYRVTVNADGRAEVNVVDDDELAKAMGVEPSQLDALERSYFETFFAPA